MPVHRRARLVRGPGRTAARGGRTIGESRVARSPVPVLFIGGYGRSGSTLVQRLAATADGVVAVGEIRHVWERGYVDDQLCGCGEPFSRCPFWNAVTERAFGGLGRDAARRIFALKRSVERPRRTHQVRFGLAGPGYRRRLARYTDVLERLYAAVRDVSGAAVVVDATKDPTHGFVLARMSGVSVRTLHLVRDSRATAHSWQRRRLRPEIHWRRQHMPVHGPVSVSARWSAANALTELLRGQGAGYERLRYEDFVRDPLRHVERLVAPFAGAGRPRVSGRTAHLGVDHTVSGNPLRFASGELVVRPDTSWRTYLPAVDAAVVTGLTAPLLLRYGYPLTGPPAP